jgi:ribosomal protein S18 acetylase RimI-like enzyme
VSDGTTPAAGTAPFVTRHGHAALLEATGDHPFVRYDVPSALAETWWQSADAGGPGDGAGGRPGAVAFRRTRHTSRHLVSLLGDDAGVARLVDALPELAREARLSPDGRGAVGVSVPQHLEALLTRRYRVLPGGDWEWFWTDSPPPPDGRAAARVVPLDDVARRDEVTAFLAAHSPTADTAPGGGERWFAVLSGAGSLEAVAALGRTSAGAPHVSSVAVDGALRGRGLGRAVVAAVTRVAVEESGVCTLGMYSHNVVARGLYRSLGYHDACAWAGRSVVLPD